MDSTAEGLPPTRTAGTRVGSGEARSDVPKMQQSLADTLAILPRTLRHRSLSRLLLRDMLKDLENVSDAGGLLTLESVTWAEYMAASSTQLKPTLGSA